MIPAHYAKLMYFCKRALCGVKIDPTSLYRDHFWLLRLEIINSSWGTDYVQKHRQTDNVRGRTA